MELRRKLRNSERLAYLNERRVVRRVVVIVLAMLMSDGLGKVVNRMHSNTLEDKIFKFRLFYSLILHF